MGEVVRAPVRQEHGIEGRVTHDQTEAEEYVLITYEESA